MTSLLPFVSVIIPIRNESKFIERCLGAVLQQSYPSERMEILIADGMSDDDTVSIIRGMDADNRVKVIENPGRIQCRGLNLLIQASRGDILVRVDGHTIIADNYVAECVRLLQETGAANVGGPMIPVGEGWLGRAIAAAGRSPFAVPSVFHVSEKAQFTDTVYLGAWPRHVLIDVGGYDETPSVNEDYELNIRIRNAGGRIYFPPTIRSTYYGRQNLRALWRQYYRYGRSKVRTLRRHPKSLRPRQIIAPVFVAGIVLGLPLILLLPALIPLYISALLAYLVLCIMFAMLQASRLGWNLFPLLPVVFITIHIAWGTGFWDEIFRPARPL